MQKNEKNSQTAGLMIILLLIGGLFILTLFMSKTDTSLSEISYSQFLTKVESGKIKNVKVYDNYMIANYNAPQGYKIYTPANTPTLWDKLEKKNVDIAVTAQNNSWQWMGLIGSLFLPILLVVALFLMFRSVQGGGSQAMSFGKSRAKLSMDKNVKVKFEDVAGIDEAKKELEEVVDFLKNPQKYTALGAKIPRGVLLVGSPGTGKTLIAKAVAGEADVPFFSISGSDFVEMFVGVGASRVRDLFEQAKKHASSIVFIDEIDAVGRQRGAGMGGGHDEREQTLNQLLVEMDGFDGTTGIIIIAATNRPDILDNALLRPGRFDRQVYIDKPDIIGREQILEVHAKGKPLAPDVELKTIAKRTPGFTGADLSNLLNEAALLAAREEKTQIEMPDLEEAIDKIIAGPEKKTRIITEEEKENTAYHEVGHALLSKFLKHGDPLHKVTIIPRGMALGVTMTLPEKDHLSYKKNQLLDRISMLLGGRIAEEMFFGPDEITTGASNDIERATELARKMVTAFGMSDKLGSIAYGKKNEHVFMGRDFGAERNYSEEVASLIDKEIKTIIQERYAIATKLIEDNKDMVEAIVKVLLEKESLDAKEFEAIMNKVIEERKETSSHDQ